MAARGLFWLKNAIICPLVPLRTNKIAKTQNIQNSIVTSVEGIIYNKYADFQPILSIFKGADTFSVEKKVRFRNAENALNGRFAAKNRPILNLKKKLLKLNKTHRNTCFVQISAHSEHFLPFYGHFKTHFGPLFLI